MASERRSGGFGATLRHARERRGISLRQIANATKISISALEALERNDISRLPGGIFSRSFVRSYAVEVGLEPEETIQQFIAQFPHDDVTAGHPGSSRIEEHDTVESDRRMASTVLRLLLVSVPVLGLLLYLGTARRNPASSERATADSPQVAAAEAIAVPATNGSPAPGSTPASPPVPIASPAVLGASPRAADRLTVALAATGPCWVAAVVDGRQVAAREFQAGDREVFEARRGIRLTFGNPAAMTMTINGADARPFGRAGVAATHMLTPDNFHAFLVTP
jgi:cytoskeleton protein RodZ